MSDDDDIVVYLVGRRHFGDIVRRLMRKVAYEHKASVFI
jgi:hypothetical protein